MRAAGKTDVARAGDAAARQIIKVTRQVQRRAGQQIDLTAVTTAGSQVQRSRSHVGRAGVMEDHPAKICDRPRAGLVEGSAVVKRMGGAIVLAEVAVGGDVEDAAGQVVDDAGHGRPVAEVQSRAGVVNDPRVVERAVETLGRVPAEAGCRAAGQDRPRPRHHRPCRPVQVPRDRHVPIALQRPVGKRQARQRLRRAQVQRRSAQRHGARRQNRSHEIVRAAGKTDVARAGDAAARQIIKVTRQVQRRAGQQIDLTAVTTAGSQVQRSRSHVGRAGVMEDHPAKICDRPRAGLVEGSAVVKRMGGAIVLAEVAVGGDVEDAAGQVVDDAGHGRPVAEVQYRAGVVNDPRVVERAVQPFEACAGEIGGGSVVDHRSSPA